MARRCPVSRRGNAPVAVAPATEAKSEGLRAASPQILADRAAGRMARARLWAAENPSAFSLMKEEARRKAGAGRRFGVQELAEWVRRSDLTDRHGAPTRIDNSIVAPLARMIVEQCPECRPYVELRTHAYDGMCAR